MQTKPASTYKKPLWHGILLVAGGAIGAGMFALPMVSAGPWFLWASLGFLLVWLVTYLSASLFAKVNISLVENPKTSLNVMHSFSSLVSYVLGKPWARANNLCIIFIMMILMYAYTTAGASIIQSSFSAINIETSPSSRAWLSLCFALATGTIVLIGTTFVSRIMLGLMLAMLISFIIAMFGIYPNLQVEKLFMAKGANSVYLLAAIPVYVTAFACTGLVPSLVRHYENQNAKVNKCIFWGTLLALFVYLIWLTATLGSIGRDGFLQIVKGGSDLGTLNKALVDAGSNPNIQGRLSLFSHCAIITSFLSVGLGLFHFIQDRLSLNKTFRDKSLAASICFVPPAIASFFFPYGFVHAIAYAGMFVAFSFFILPGILALSVFKNQHRPLLKTQSYLAIIFGVLIIILKIAMTLSLLPTFR
ncbi:amino acid permease [Glaciecola petra]|uniref:Aromatic amino acid transport family protein n=1 Tax=Glaciecola petra TaxID=3075602 RepID=A0ABU2ZWF2_9ALTE|nr:aromatic amino acid transport family protein [Aestuariibacter sp. P117]MDT0596576.1 aromatic amino acid transport family protein [Aestuariibacter sp. P117]